jgi:hypothetical protein
MDKADEADDNNRGSYDPFLPDDDDMPTGPNSFDSFNPLADIYQKILLMLYQQVPSVVEKNIMQDIEDQATADTKNKAALFLVPFQFSNKTQAQRRTV